MPFLPVNQAIIDTRDAQATETRAMALVEGMRRFPDTRWSGRRSVLNRPAGPDKWAWRSGEPTTAELWRQLLGRGRS